MKKQSPSIILILAGVLVMFTALFLFEAGRSHRASASGYSFYRTISIVPANVSGTLTNFPLLFYTTSTSYLAASSSAGSVQNASGYDIVFGGDSSCSSKYNFEVESYTSSTGAMIAWIQIPTLTSTTVFFMCYGNGGISTDQSSKSATWDSNYKFVLHFPNGTALSANDSTANGNNGTINSATAGSSPIFGGAQFSSSNVTVAATSSINVSGGDFTVSTWFYMNSQTSYETLFDKGGGSRDLSFWINGTNNGFYAVGNVTGNTWSGSGWTTGAWHYFTWTRAGGLNRFYLDGSQNFYFTDSNSGNGGYAFSIGGNPSGGGTTWNGVEDEFRLSNIARGANWISAEYTNQSSPASGQGLYTIGSQQTYDPTATSTWVSTGSASWNTPGNWSSGSVPTQSTPVLFSASSTVSATIDAAASVRGVSIVSGYTGTITQSSNYAFTVGTSSFYQQAGTFQGGSGRITIQNGYALTGGTFISTTGKLSLYGSSTFAGTFQNNSGTVVLAASSSAAVASGSVSLYNLWLGDGSGSSNAQITIATGTTLTVWGSVTFAPQSSEVYLLGGGQINALGNVSLSGAVSGTAPTSTFNLVLGGAGAQTISDGGFGTAPNPFPLPGVTANNSKATVFLSGKFMSLQALTVATGELRVASSATAQTMTVVATTTVSSGAIFSDYAQNSSTIQFGSSVVNSGAMLFDGSGGGCSPTANYIFLRSSVGGTQRSWSGSGSFVVRYVDVKDQAGSANISVSNGTNSGNNGGNWSFLATPQAQFVQNASSTGTSGTNSLTIPLGFPPRAGDLLVVAVSSRNQGIASPTDSAGNTYRLMASSTFGSAALAVYYAANASTVLPAFSVTANGTSSVGGNLLSASVLEYTGMSSTSTFYSYSGNVDTTGSGVALTSGAVAGSLADQVYFGAMALGALTTASPNSPWIDRADVTNNNTTQSLYTEDIATSSALTTAATWTSNASTTYGAFIGIFRSPFANNYVASGTLDSAIFDTGVTSGTAINSVIWQGTMPSTSGVGFQFAFSNSSSGPWNYSGPSGVTSYYGYTSPGIGSGPSSAINLGYASNNYSGFTGYRYFRYRMGLFSDPSHGSAPTVTQVTVNWSP